MKKISIKKLFSIINRKGSLQKRGLYRPHKDWLIIISIFMVLLVVSIAGHYALYTLVEKGDMFNKTAEEEVFKAALKRETINKVVEEFSDKEVNTTSFNQNRGVVTDPS